LSTKENIEDKKNHKELAPVEDEQRQQKELTDQGDLFYNGDNNEKWIPITNKKSPDFDDSNSENNEKDSIEPHDDLQKQLQDLVEDSDFDNNDNDNESMEALNNKYKIGPKKMFDDEEKDDFSIEFYTQTQKHDGNKHITL